LPDRATFNPIVNKQQWLRKIKWRELKIKKTERTCCDIRVELALGVNRGQEIAYVTLQKIDESPEYHLVREMEKAITANPKIRLGQSIPRDIKFEKLCVFVAI